MKFETCIIAGLTMLVSACVSKTPADLDAGDGESETAPGESDSSLGESDTEPGESDTEPDETEDEMTGEGPDLGDDTAPDEGVLEAWGFTRHEPGIFARWVGVADFDDDGELDLFTSWGKTFLGDGSGAFTQTAEIAPGTFGGLVGTGDFDGDGDLDIAVRDTDLHDRFYTLLNDGTGAFADPIIVPYDGSYDLGASALHANDDGIHDLFIPKGYGQGGSFLFASGDGDFGVELNLPSPACYFSDTVAVDFDGDGLDELVGTGSCNQVPDALPLSIYREVDGVYVADQIIASDVAKIAEGGDILLLDTDDDGDLDIVTPAVMGLFELENLGAGVFADPPAVMAHEYDAWGGKLFRLHLGPNDIAFVVQGSSEAELDGALLVPDEDFEILTTTELPLDGKAVGANDFDGDGANDLLVSVGQEIVLWLSGG